MRRIWIGLVERQSCLHRNSSRINSFHYFRSTIFDNDNMDNVDFSGEEKKVWYQPGSATMLLKKRRGRRSVGPSVGQLVRLLVRLSYEDALSVSLNSYKPVPSQLKQK